MLKKNLSMTLIYFSVVWINFKKRSMNNDKVQESKARVGRPQTHPSLPPPPSINFIADRRKAALMCSFFGGFRCGVRLCFLIIVIYKIY